MPRDYRDAVIETLTDRESELEQSTATYRMMLLEALEHNSLLLKRNAYLERVASDLRRQLRERVA